jgi:hypothetical protein
MTAEHPSNHLLEEIASGGAHAETEAHIAACAACATYVDKLSSAARAFGESEEGDAERFIRKLAARSENIEKTKAKKRAPLWLRAVWVAAPLAAAALAVLVFWPPSAPPTELSPTPRGDRFKGALQVAAIVDREGRQERVTGEVGVGPGDRLRLEVSLDRTGPIAGGILETDGTWTLLLAPTELEAGTHFSELAARFDDNPTTGFILVGEPDRIERARTTRDFTGLTVLRIVPAQ